MSQDTRLTTAQRKALFRALVDAQDAGQSGPESRQAVADKYGVTEEAVRKTEEEGINREWPPL